MAASGSEGESGRPWTASCTWAPAGGGAVEDAISFETSEDDAEASPAGVVLSRPDSGPDGEAPPCEVTVSFRGVYEIHRVYVRSTARIYEIYHSTNPKDASKDYLCTVRCGLAVKEPEPSGEKREHETKSVSSSSDEDSWVDVKIPETPMGKNTSDSQESNAVGTCHENNLAHYEATAEMTDVSPCVSLTVRLLSLQSKASVHIEEIYVFADHVESTNDNSVTVPGNIGGSSLLAMLVPGLMQMSKSRNWKIDDGYFSHGSRTEPTEDCAIQESRPYEKIAQEAGACSTNNGTKYQTAGMESGVHPTDGRTVSNEKSNQGEFQLKDPKSLPLPVQTTENAQVSSVKGQQVYTDQLANPLMNENFTPYNHIERKLDTLLSKVEKMELYFSRFDESMIKPLGSIETRLQRLEQQFDSFSMEIQSLRGSSARMSAPVAPSNTANCQEKAHNDGNARTPSSIADSQPGLVLRAPDFSSEDSSSYNVTDGNQVNIRGPNLVPRLLVKVPDFISQPELTSEKLHNGSFSAVDLASSSEKVRKISPGLVVKVPEFPDDDDDDEVEGEKEAEVGDHDDGHTQYDDTLSKSTADSSKSKNHVSINGALASALKALLTSTKGTPSSESSVFIASNVIAENTNDSSNALSHEKVDGMTTKDGLSDQCLGTFGGPNLVGTISCEEIDASPRISLSKAMLDGKVEVNEQNNDLSPEKVACVASTGSLGVPSQPQTVEGSIDDESRANGENNGPNSDTIPFVASTGPLDHPQPPTVFGSIVNGAQVNENRPAISLAEFLAAKRAGSCKKGISEVCCGNNGDGAEILSFERTSGEAGKNKKNISQLLVKKALEADADDREQFCNVPTWATSEGSGYAAPEKAYSGYNNINTIETQSGKDCGLEYLENKVGFVGHGATDFKNKWFGNSSVDWSLDESFSKPNVEHSWSSSSSMESFSGAPAKEPAVSANMTSGKYVEDLLAGIGVSSTVTPITWEELHKVCDFYEYKDDMLGMASTAKRTSKSSPSLEALLGESSDSEVQISDLEDLDNGACFGSTQLLGSLSSSDDDDSPRTQPLVDVVDLRAQSEVYTAAVNEPLVDVADLTNPSGTYAPMVNEPLADVFDLPNSSEACASAVNESLASVDDVPKPQETFTGGSSGEHANSLI